MTTDQVMEQVRKLIFLPDCPACGWPWDTSKVAPPRVPLGIRCACCCQDGEGNPDPVLLAN